MVGTAFMHEHDPRWTAVDQYVLPHLQSSTSPLQASLAFAITNAERNNLPDIAVSALQGQFLSLQCKLIRAKHVLEVGTLGGYSTIWLASSAPDVHVTSIEIDERHAAVATESIEHAGMSGRVDVIVGSGADVLATLAEELKQGKREMWDFVFIDADKVNNRAYLDVATGMSRSGACLIVDNVVRRGGVADAELAKTDKNVEGSRSVIEEAGRDERLEATVVQMVGEKNYDGMLICCVR